MKKKEEEEEEKKKLLMQLSSPGYDRLTISDMPSYHKQLKTWPNICSNIFGIGNK